MKVNMKKTGLMIAMSVSAMSWSANKIVGGVESSKGEFPYIVSMQKSSFFGGSSHFCGGSLIKSNWVLTAAHCVVGGTKNVKIKIGLHGLSDTTGVETFTVKKVIVHPQYNSSKSDYDYALVQLSGNSSKRVVALNTSEISIPENENVSPLVTVAGWGTTTEGGSIPSRLRKVSIPLITQARCNSAYSNKITSRMICAGQAKGGKDSCQGDSGGPLVIKENNGEVRLVGVVSWGDGCARPNKYGVYAKVNAVVSWIAQNTK